MATSTNNLGLYKKDPATDGRDTFNIGTMLNENWDKVDEFAGRRDNPHQVTAQQVGATPAAHASNTNNPHQVTAAQVGAATMEQVKAAMGSKIDRFCATRTEFSGDIVTSTDKTGNTLVTTFQTDGSIKTVYNGVNGEREGRLTTFNADGSITTAEVVV